MNFSSIYSLLSLYCIISRSLVPLGSVKWGRIGGTSRLIPLTFFKDGPLIILWEIFKEGSGYKKGVVSYSPWKYRICLFIFFNFLQSSLWIELFKNRSSCSVQSSNTSILSLFWLLFYLFFLSFFVVVVFFVFFFYINSSVLSLYSSIFLIHLIYLSASTSSRSQPRYRRWHH